VDHLLRTTEEWYLSQCFYVHNTFNKRKKSYLWDDPEHDGSSRYWKASRKEDRARKKSKRKYCGKMEETGSFSLVTMYKMEMLLRENI
jgi:hypothetical protein